MEKMTTLNREQEINWEEDYYFLALIGNKLLTGDGMIRRKLVIRRRFAVLSQLIIHPDKDYEKIRNFHRLSGEATIGISSDKEARKHGFQYLELAGSDDQVKIAEDLIKKVIEETYKDEHFIAPAFMDPHFYFRRIPLPEENIWALMGRGLLNFTIIESQTGAWLEVDYDDTNISSDFNGIRIYGSNRSQVKDAADLLNKIIPKLEPVTTERVRELLCEEIPAVKEYYLREAEKQLPSKKQKNESDENETSNQPSLKKQKINNDSDGNETTDMEDDMVA